MVRVPCSFWASPKAHGTCYRRLPAEEWGELPWRRRRRRRGRGQPSPRGKGQRRPKRSRLSRLGDGPDSIVGMHDMPSCWMQNNTQAHWNHHGLRLFHLNVCALARLGPSVGNIVTGATANTTIVTPWTSLRYPLIVCPTTSDILGCAIQGRGLGF